MKRFATFVVFATCTILTGKADAGFSICNQTLEMANVAIGQSEQGQFLTRGWWKIGPNQCADVIREPLAARFLYVYASDIFGKELLNGSVPLCIGTERFIISGQEDCALRGHVSVKFIEVDTNSAQEWTLFLSSPAE
jgi:uncharacterized membrane protein